MSQNYGFEELKKFSFTVIAIYTFETFALPPSPPRHRRGCEVLVWKGMEWQPRKPHHPMARLIFLSTRFEWLGNKIEFGESFQNQIWRKRTMFLSTSVYIHIYILFHLFFFFFAFFFFFSEHVRQLCCILFTLARDSVALSLTWQYLGSQHSSFLRLIL